MTKNSLATGVRPRQALVVAWLLLHTASAWGETSEQLWIDYNPSWWASERVQFFGDLGYRTQIDARDSWRLVVRPSVAYSRGAFRWTAGLGNFLSFYDQLNDRWELRPFQGVSTVWPEGQLSLEHYVRLEQRFDFNTETWDSLNSLRIRYQVLARYRISAFQAERQWSLVGIAEPFLKLAGDEGVQREQFRLTAGLQRDVGAQGSVRFELSWQQEQIFFRPSESVDEFFFRLRLYH